MAKSERHKKIVAALDFEPTLRVNQLAKRFQVSSETIRRDLFELGERGLIQRTYGGAVRIISEEPSITERHDLMLTERLRIARFAAERVKPNQVLMLSGGATTRVLARVLTDIAYPITVITPSFGAAQALGSNPSVSIQMLPGAYNAHEEVVQGAETLEALQRYRADHAFLGASGISSTGASEVAAPTGLIYQTMADRSARTTILADSSKHGKTAFFEYLRWRRGVTLITEKMPNENLTRAILETGANLELAK